MIIDESGRTSRCIKNLAKIKDHRLRDVLKSDGTRSFSREFVRLNIAISKPFETEALRSASTSNATCFLTTVNAKKLESYQKITVGSQDSNVSILYHEMPHETVAPPCLVS